jgi:hypothetical protein
MQDLLAKAKNESFNDLIKESIRSEPDHVTSKVLDTSSDEKEDLPFQENPISNKIRISQTNKVTHFDILFKKIKLLVFIILKK